MFALHVRPKGLEVPACHECNQATSNFEQVAALLGRIYPNGKLPAESQELLKIFRAVKNNMPDVLEEMMPCRIATAQLKAATANVIPPDAAGFMKIEGPLVNECMQIFGAKLGFALHYELTTKKRIVPVAGGVFVRWYPNVDALTGEIPQDLFQLLGPAETLRQGKKHVTDQFQYAFARTDAEDAAIYFCTFRKSFAVASCVSEDISSLGLGNIESNEFHRPGEFKLLRSAGGC